MNESQFKNLEFKVNEIIREIFGRIQQLEMSTLEQIGAAVYIKMAMDKFIEGKKLEVSWMRNKQ